MRPIAIVLLLLSCALIAPAQTHREPGPVDDSSFGPPPQVLTFEGRQVFRPGDDIKGPMVITAPDPAPLKDFRSATVKLWCVVGIDGKAHMIKVAKHESLEADMKAIENLKQWKFKPAKKKMDEVDTLIGVEVVWR